jgi:hypothetical protein
VDWHTCFLLVRYPGRFRAGRLRFRSFCSA